MTLLLQKVTRLAESRPRVNEVDLELAPGSLCVLLGPVGAGKTTLLRLMAGLEAPSSGRVLLEGREVHRVSPRERNVGFVHQKFVNYPTRSVFENIAAPLRQGGTAKGELARRVREVASRLHIEGLLERRPGELSGGQQQRTALGRALARPGGLLLLDEPLVNLDYKLREELRRELRDLFAEEGATIVYATSDPAEALALGGRTVVMDGGQVLQQGDAQAVYKRPASIRVGELTSVPPMNLIPGRLEQGQLGLADVRQAAAAHLSALGAGSYQFGVRPHQLGLERRSPADLELAAVVELAELSGSETFVHLRLVGALGIGGPGAAWVAHQVGAWPRALGERLSVFLDPAAIYAFHADGSLAAAPAH